MTEPHDEGTVMKPRGSRGRVPFSGILLITLGVLFLAGTLGWIDAGELIERWWPALFIVIGLEQILNAPRARVSGALLVAIGAIMLAFTLARLPWHVIERFWPALLIVVGLWIVFKPSR